MIPAEWIAPVLGFLGVALGAVLTYLGVKYTARQSAKAAETAAQVNARQVDVEEWRAIVGALREEVGRLTSRVSALEARRESDNVLIDTLRAEADARDARYRLLLRHTLAVLAWATDHLPDHTPPRPPAALASELEGPAPP